MSQNSKSNKKNSKLKNYLLTQFIFLIGYICLFLIISAICVSTDVGAEYVQYVSLVMVLLFSFSAGFIAGRKERKNGIISGIVAALPLNCIMVVISVIMNGFKVDLNLFFTILIGLLSSSIGGIISVNMRLKK